jgi:hypothetical protein
LNYLSKSKGQEVPADGWRWITSGRVMDVKEAWGTDQPNRAYINDKDSYESCIALDGERNNLHDHNCDTRWPIICQKIVQGNEEERTQDDTTTESTTTTTRKPSRNKEIRE